MDIKQLLSDAEDAYLRAYGAQPAAFYLGRRELAAFVAYFQKYTSSEAPPADQPLEYNGKPVIAVMEESCVRADGPASS